MPPRLVQWSQLFAQWLEVWIPSPLSQSLTVSPQAIAPHTLQLSFASSRSQGMRATCLGVAARGAGFGRKSRAGPGGWERSHPQISCSPEGAWEAGDPLDPFHRHGETEEDRLWIPISKLVILLRILRQKGGVCESYSSCQRTLPQHGSGRNQPS